MHLRCIFLKKNQEFSQIYPLPIPTGQKTNIYHNTVIYPGVYRYYVLSSLCFPFLDHFFISSEIKTKKKTQRTSANMFSDREYHLFHLKRVFIKHYRPWDISRKYKNHAWTLHLSDSTTKELRQHYSWIVQRSHENINVFNWGRLRLGEEIINLFKEFKFLNALICRIRKEAYIRRIDENLRSNLNCM